MTEAAGGLSVVTFSGHADCGFAAKPGPASYASNEIRMHWPAALVFVLAGVLS
jgi:hypothetical protein